LHDAAEPDAATSPISIVALATTPSPTFSPHSHHFTDLSFVLIGRSEAERSGRRAQQRKRKQGLRRRQQIRDQPARPGKVFLFLMPLPCNRFYFGSCSIQDMHPADYFFYYSTIAFFRCVYMNKYSTWIDTYVCVFSSCEICTR
jgi:hypothetical protein